MNKEIKKGYYGNGQLNWEYEYLNGKPHGVSKWYHDNGQLKWEYEYLNGEPQGVSKGYYENGQLEWECEYQDGKKHGVSKEYYENGELNWEDEYLNGTIIKQPISKMETTEKKIIQEFEPITKYNIEEVLKYNGWEYDSREIYDEFSAYNCPDLYSPYYISIRQKTSSRLEFYFSGIDDYEGDSINTTCFDEFLAFVQKRVELKPLPKKPEFDFEQYLLDNDFVHKFAGISLIKNNLIIWKINNNSYEIEYPKTKENANYAQTKENADILISVVKLLKGLK